VSVGAVTVEIVVGVTSGLVGSVVGAASQRWQFKHQERVASRSALWDYERVLENEGEYLTHPTYYGVDGLSRNEPGELERARAAAYSAIQELPAELRDDLLKELPSFDTAFEAGDHIQSLATRLRNHLREHQ
jgi:hypothetical protein